MPMVHHGLRFVAPERGPTKRPASHKRLTPVGERGANIRRDGASLACLIKLKEPSAAYRP